MRFRFPTADGRSCVRRGRLSATWAEDTLAGLADGGTTLDDATELLVGRIAIAADGPAFALPVPQTSPRWLASTPTRLRTRRRVCLRTEARRGSCTSRRVRTRSRARGRCWSQGELDECRKQAALLLGQG